MEHTKTSVNMVDFLTRYFLIILLIPLYNLFSLIFSPLTIYSSYFFINLFYKASLIGNTIIFSGFDKQIELISSCIAVLAYILLFALNLSIKMPLKKRMYSLGFSFLSLFIFNVLRIVILSLFFVGDYAYFSQIHKFFWYFGSILIVFVIWIVSIRLFKIKEIPVYSDFKELIKIIKKKP